MSQSKGTFKFAYDDRDLNSEVVKRGVKVVDKKTLPYFVMNEFEKKTISDPDANILFDQKIRPGLYATQQKNNDDVSTCLVDDYREPEAKKRKTVKVNGKKVTATKELYTNSERIKDTFNHTSNSYLDNYRKHKKNDQDQQRKAAANPKNQQSADDPSKQAKKGKRQL